VACSKMPPSIVPRRASSSTEARMLVNGETGHQPVQPSQRRPPLIAEVTVGEPVEGVCAGVRHVRAIAFSRVQAYRLGVPGYTCTLDGLVQVTVKSLIDDQRMWKIVRSVVPRLPPSPCKTSHRPDCTRSVMNRCRCDGMSPGQGYQRALLLSGLPRRPPHVFSENSAPSVMARAWRSFHDLRPTSGVTPQFSARVRLPCRALPETEAAPDSPERSTSSGLMCVVSTSPPNTVMHSCNSHAAEAAQKKRTHRQLLLSR
jgi:hypothetical protein